MTQLRRAGSVVCQRSSSSPTSWAGSTAVYNQPERLQSTYEVRVADSELSQAEWNRTRPLNEMPGFTKLSMIVNFMPGGKFNKLSFTDVLEKLHRYHGDIFQFPSLFGRDAVVITFNPEDFEKVQRSEGKCPIRKSFTVLGQYRSVVQKDFFQGVEGLLHTNGEQWSSFRSVVNPILMHSRNVKPYLTKMSKINAEFLQRIRDIRDPTTLEVPATFDKELNRFALESVSIVALGKEIGLIRKNRDNKEAEQLFEDLTTSFQLTYELEVQPSIWKLIPTAKYRQTIACIKRMENFVIKQVQEAINRVEQTTSDSPESEEGVLEKLLRIDKKIATVMAMDMLFTGVDTTSSTLAGVLLLLAKNPDKQQKLRQELRQVLPHKESPLTEDGLTKLTYLRACIKESLRMYPLVAGTFRATGKDLVLSGYRVPKGTNVFVANYVCRNDPKYYVDPLKFHPERWLRSSEGGDEIQGTSTANPFVYLPFGFGPRTCVGRRIAELEIGLAIAKIIRNFNVEFNYSTENAFKNYFLFVPAIPLKFKFTDLAN